MRWSAADSIAACPAGDSLALAAHSAHPHPSRLRVSVEYFDNLCNPRAGIPPDSIWLEYATTTGNVVVNDKGVKVFADDTTDACGFARITVPSLSGCGQLTVYLYISGVSQGSQTITVRTTDTNADGRSTSADVAGLCDVNYDGLPNSGDLSVIVTHDQHWRRNALHGTLVRRTNLSHVDHGPGSIGGSTIFWSPSGRYLSYTKHEQTYGQCLVYLVASDPAFGNVPVQVTSSDSADYDPSWSPLNNEIAFDRADYRIIGKQIPWLGSTQRTITASGNPDDNGDVSPAISPNGRWVAFSRKNQVTQDYHIWKIPITGGTPTQVTFTSGVADWYPEWSPDGEWITFDREIGYPNEHNTYKAKANQTLPGDTAAIPVYRAPSGTNAATPGWSADGLIITAGLGTQSETVLDTRTHTLDPSLSPTKPILNYPDTAFAIASVHPVLSPRISPDGTRLVLASRQVWAARRNMNLPPAFNSVSSPFEGTRTIPDTAATMSFRFDPFEVSNVTVTATDPEGDALTYRANFLESWMTWNPVTRTLSGVPPSGSIGDIFYVKFWVTTPSGGTDSFIGVITVASTLGPAGLAPTANAQEEHGRPKLVDGQFSIESPTGSGLRASLSIFDLAGRRIALVTGESGTTLTWDGRDVRSGSPAAPGIYFYRMEAGSHRREGKLAVIR